MKENIVCYIQNDLLIINKRERYIGGLHAYTYGVDEVGKRKLGKGVATTKGYFVGNHKLEGSVVGIIDYLCATLTNGSSLVDCGLDIFLSVFDHIFKEENKDKYFNVLFICRDTVFGKIATADIGKMKANNRLEMTDKDFERVEKLQTCIKEWKALGNNVFFDSDSAVEGGTGNKLASKHSGLGKIETTVKGAKRLIFGCVDRKTYEDPGNDFNKIVCAGRWYMSTGKETDYWDDFGGYRAYNFGRVEPDKKYYGKLTPDVTFANLYTRQPIKLLDKIFAYCQQLVPNPNEYLSAGILSNVVSRDVARIVDTFPGVKKGNDILIPFESAGKEEPTLVELIDPPMLSYQIRVNIKKVHNMFNLFQNRDELNRNGHTEFIDISHLIYQDEVNKKGVNKRKLNPEFKQGTQVFKIPVHHRNAKVPVDIMLSIGYDLPDRTNLNSCCDELAKVWVGVDTQNERGIRYFCVVETQEWIYIQTSAVANLRILNVKELGLEIPKEEKK